MENPVSEIARISKIAILGQNLGFGQNVIFGVFAGFRISGQKIAYFLRLRVKKVGFT